MIITLPKLQALAAQHRKPRALEGFGAVRNLIAKRLEDLSPLLGGLEQGAGRSRGFH
jgi:hypothetical protein